MTGRFKELRKRESVSSPYSHPLKGIGVAALSAAGFLLWLVALAAVVRWLVQ